MRETKKTEGGCMGKLYNVCILLLGASLVFLKQFESLSKSLVPFQLNKEWFAMMMISGVIFILISVINFYSMYEIRRSLQKHN